VAVFVAEPRAGNKIGNQGRGTRIKPDARFSCARLARRRRVKALRRTPPSTARARPARRKSEASGARSHGFWWL